MKQTSLGNAFPSPLQFGSDAKANRKVAIIGAGNVGSSAATSIIHGNLCDELALFDTKPGIAEGKGLDLAQASAAIGADTKVYGSDQYSVIDNADIVIVTAGRPRAPGESRSDFLSMGAKILGSICNEIKVHAPKAKLIMVSNPLDMMAYMGQKITGFPAKHVMGMGGLLDTSRMQEAIAKIKNVPLQSVKALVIGEHGDSMIPMFRLSTINGQPADQVLTEEEQRQVTEATVKGGGKLAGLLAAIKSASSHGPGASIARMVKAILNDTKETLPCSVQLNDQFASSGLPGKGLYVGVPAVLGADGVEEVKPLSLNATETVAWGKAVEAVQANIQAAEAILNEPAVNPA
ncbi:MAG: malate dehydrogenase [Cyanobacteria bacterium]|nr:malate dehydrogenase [Cyanobacteriota bacterium]